MQKGIQEYEGLRMDVVAKLRACIESQSKTVEQFFDELSENGTAKVFPNAIMSFLLENKCDVTSENLEAIFSSPFGNAIAQDAKDAAQDDSVLSPQAIADR